VKTHLLDCIRDARLGEGVVLERLGKVLIDS
jgi:hypothetical protein